MFGKVPYISLKYEVESAGEHKGNNTSDDCSLNLEYCTK